MKNLTFLVLTHMPMPKHLKSFLKKKGMKVYYYQHMIKNKTFQSIFQNKRQFINSLMGL